MTDPKIFARAVNTLRRRRENAQAQQAAHQSEVYRRVPRIQEIDVLLRGTMSKIAAAALKSGDDPQLAIANIRRENLDLQAERAELLVVSGYPMDYLDLKYSCPKCKDTGRLDGRSCHCLEDLCRRLQQQELSSMLDLGGQSFENFNFDYYSDETDPRTGLSPRDNIAMIYDLCCQYARRFGDPNAGAGKNLFLNGGTGLGKTFLSACIAGEVAAAGYSVVYDTAVSIMDKFEASRFNRDDGQSREAVNRFFDCDLLIMDDLGTELITSYSLSSLYTLINTRLIKGKHTVINSNLLMDDIRRKYTPQILSRLEGEYTTLFFFGRDIRLVRKEGRV